MADEVSCETARNVNNRVKIIPIQVLESDEEEEQSHEQLFEGFIKAIEPYLERREILPLRVQFTAIRRDFACSSSFKTLLRRKTSQVKKSDVYIHVDEVLKQLLENQTQYGSKKPTNSEENTDDNKFNEESNDPRGGKAGEFEIGKQAMSQTESHVRTMEPVAGPSRSITNDDSDIEVIEIEVTSKPSTSKPQIPFVIVEASTSKSQGKEATEVGHKNARQNTQNGVSSDSSKTKRKKLIVKLEARLQLLSEEIRRLGEAELSLEEMELSNSSYMIENRLKKKFNEIWNKICKLKGRPTDTGRVTEKEVRCRGTGFPKIDKAVRRFLKNRTTFPDIFDIKYIVDKAKKKYNLQITPVGQQDIAIEIFTDIGNKMQDKRKKDLEKNFGCYLTDDYRPSLDPALNSHALLYKLEENKKNGKRALEEVFRKYVHLGRQKGTNGIDCKVSDVSSEFDSEDEKTINSPRHKRQRTDTYESDSEKELDIESSQEVEAATENITQESESCPEIISSRSDLSQHFSDDADDSNTHTRASDSETCGPAKDLQAEVDSTKSAQGCNKETPVEILDLGGEEAVSENEKSEHETSKKHPRPCHPPFKNKSVQSLASSAKKIKLDAKVLELLRNHSKPTCTSTPTVSCETSNVTMPVPAVCQNPHISSASTSKRKGTHPHRHVIKNLNDACRDSAGQVHSLPHSSPSLSSEPESINPGTTESVPYQSPLQMFRSHRHKVMQISNGIDKSGSNVDNSSEDTHLATLQCSSIESSGNTSSLPKNGTSDKNIIHVVLSDDDDDD